VSGQTATRSVRSADGTRIAFERSGHGAPLVLIEAAGHYRGLSSFGGLAPLLSSAFTIYQYDRRGRGESGDTPPYSPDREVEDIGALIADGGGSAHLYGYSSGALLALRAAARGLPITRLAVLEPPLQDDDAAAGPDPLTIELGELVAAGREGDAVEHFHRSIGVPDEFIAEMKAGASWARMEAVAHTLVYDCLLSDAMSPALIRSVTTPTLVLDSQGSSDDLTGGAARVAQLLPNGAHRSLPGEWHGLADDTLAPALIAFFRG
jgi:pimeloyl-ACP methyl ester carboxylesterase